MMLKIDSGTQNYPRKCFSKKSSKTRFWTPFWRLLEIRLLAQRSAHKPQKSTLEKFFGKTLSRVILGPWIDFEHQIWRWVTLRCSKGHFWVISKFAPKCLAERQKWKWPISVSSTSPPKFQFWTKIMWELNLSLWTALIKFEPKLTLWWWCGAHWNWPFSLLALSKAFGCKFWDESKMAFRAS